MRSSPASAGELTGVSEISLVYSRSCKKASVTRAERALKEGS